jgi:hypothetical protein
VIAIWQCKNKNNLATVKVAIVAIVTVIIIKAILRSQVGIHERIVNRISLKADYSSS